MRYRYFICDVFTDTRFGGNQLAVLPEATGLSDGRMQQVAREFNFAETTFVLPPEDGSNTARLRIFSPGAEMPFAGHPTVGTAAALVRRGVGRPSGTGPTDLTFEEQVGPVRVAVHDDDRGMYSELTLNAELDRPPGVPANEALAAALSLPADSVRRAWFAGVGLPFCFCQVATAADVDAAVLDKAAWTQALGEARARHVFFFTGDLVDGAELYARMFAPSIGIDEDPATGSASAALAGCLALECGADDADPTLTIRQGFAMGRPSIIRAGARLRSGRLEHVTVGGRVVEFAVGSFAVPGETG
jgi:trans-2,3-dihydro-3-hydroxyanthranilate isomerase